MARYWLLGIGGLLALGCVVGVLLVGWSLLGAGGRGPEVPQPLTADKPDALKERERLSAEANRLWAAGKQTEAIEALEKRLAIDRETFGDAHEEVAKSMETIAELQELREVWEAARKWREEVVRIQTNLHGGNDWRVTDARLALGQVTLLEKIGPEKRRQLDGAADLNNQMARLDRLGKAPEAVRLARQVLAIHKEVLGKGHPDYALSLVNLAAMCEAMGDYDEARPLYEEAESVCRAALGERHPRYAGVLNNLGFLHKSKGDYKKAQPLYEKAREVFKTTVGEKHPDYARSLNNLAELYRSMQDYEKSRPLHEQARDIRKAALGDRHAEYAQSLNNLGLLAFSMGDYQKARPLYEQARDIRKGALGDRHPDYADSLNNLATLHKVLQEHDKALPLFEEAQRIYKGSIGDRHPRYANCLNNLAALYESTGEYQKARVLYEEAQKVFKVAVGEKHPQYLDSFNRLAGLYKLMGDYESALPLHEESRDLTRAALGDRHPLYADSLNNLGLVYKSMGDYEKARRLYEEARELFKAAEAGKGPGYATTLNNLGVLSEWMGEYEKARSLHEQARESYKAALGDKHPLYANSLNNLALLYYSMGDYEKARPLHEQARDLRKVALGDKHPDYVQSLNSLAGLYCSMGDHEQARALYEQARDVRKAALGDRHPDYAQSLNDLALLCYSMGDSKQGATLCEQAREIFRGTFGNRHPEYATTLNNLAVLYSSMGDYQKAQLLLEEALQLREAAFGTKHPEYAASLNNLAMVHRERGKYETALPLLEQARDALKTALGDRHPHYARSLNNLAVVHLELKNPTQAEALFDRAHRIQEEHLNATFTVLGDRQRLDFLNNTNSSLDWYLTLAAGGKAPAARAYDHVLAWKGVILGRAVEDRLALEDPAFVSSLQKLHAVRGGLAQLTNHPPTPAGQKTWLRSFQKLEEDKEKLEQELARLSKDYLRLRKRRAASAEHVAAALPEATALVDFLVYSHNIPDTDKKGKWNWKRRLLAFVVLRGQEPILVDLGAADPIDKAIQAWRKPLTSVPAGPLDTEAGTELSRRLWQPLQKHLKGISTVLIAPDGELCGLPFAALPGSKPNTYLLEEVAIGYVVSGRHLLESVEEERLASEGLLTLGGLAFGKPSKEGAPSRFEPWTFLPGSLFEAERLSALWCRTFPSGRAPVALTAAAGDKTKLQQVLAPSKDSARWRYLHLATHGFFTPPEPEQTKKAASKGDLFTLQQEHVTYRRNPLLLSGLVLSGANKDPDKGLMTAEEVSALDLRGADLVVLSACDTGLGKVAGGQGVYGLQRAFQEAGARSLAVSLWSVSDPATSVLMEEFYAQLWGKEKISKLEALRRAQLKVLREPSLVEARRKELEAELKKRDLGDGVGLRRPGKTSILLPDGGKPSEGRSHPVEWAAFVLSGDWR